MNKKKLFVASLLFLFGVLFLKVDYVHAEITVVHPGNNSGCTHDWILNIESPATCTSSGYEEYQCPICGADGESYPPALGHNYRNYTTTVQPTCTSGGRERGTCTRCGNYDYNDLNPLGHDFGSWYRSVEPTCESGGTDKQDCSRCSEYNTRGVNALGHLISGWTPTASSDTRHKECTRSGCNHTQDWQYVVRLTRQNTDIATVTSDIWYSQGSQVTVSATSGRTGWHISRISDGVFNVVNNTDSNNMSGTFTMPNRPVYLTVYIEPNKISIIFEKGITNN